MRQRNGKNEENLTFDLKLARVLKPAHKINKQIGPHMRASILQAVQACFKYAMVCINSLGTMGDFLHNWFVPIR